MREAEWLHLHFQVTVLLGGMPYYAICFITFLQLITSICSLTEPDSTVYEGMVWGHAILLFVKYVLQ